MDRARPAKAGGGGAAQSGNSDEASYLPSKQSGFARLQAERADAAASIGRTLKVWRSIADGGEKQQEDTKGQEEAESKEGANEEKDEKSAAGGPEAEKEPEN